MNLYESIKNNLEEEKKGPKTVPEFVEKNIEDEEDAIEHYNKFIAFVKENKIKNADKIVEVLAEVIEDEEDHINKLVGIDNDDFDVKDQDEKELKETEKKYSLYNDFDEDKKVIEYTYSELVSLLKKEIEDNIRENETEEELITTLNDTLEKLNKNELSAEDIIKELSSYSFYLNEKELKETEDRKNKDIVEDLAKLFNSNHKDLYNLEVRVENGVIKVFDSLENFSYSSEGDFYIDGAEFGVEGPIDTSSSFEDDLDEFQNYLEGAFKTPMYLEEESPYVYVIGFDSVDGDSEVLKESVENPMFILELPAVEQTILKNALKKALINLGYTGDELISGINDGLESKIYDIKETIEHAEDAEANKILSKYIFLTDEMHNNLKNEISEQHAGVTITEGIDTTYPNFEKATEEYMQPSGDGDNWLSQFLTAVNKLIYKHYNDGDTFDNTHNQTYEGWANDISGPANWLDKFGPQEIKILLEEWINNKSNTTDKDYAEIIHVLEDLSEEFITNADLEELTKKPKQGNVYSEKGIYSWEEPRDDEEDEEEEY